MRIGHAVLAAALFVSGATQAQAVTINFDDAANGDVINTLYASLGVSFSCVNGANPAACGTSDIFARAQVTNNSAPNVISTVSVAEGSFASNREEFGGIIRADFSSAVTSVSLDAFTIVHSSDGFGAPAMGYLTAFNGATVLGTVMTTATGVWQTLSFSAPSITALQFSGSVTTSQAASTFFDNLTFDGGEVSGPGGGDGGGTPVPEPASLLLAALGMAGVVAGRRQRRA